MIVKQFVSGELQVNQDSTHFWNVAYYYIIVKRKQSINPIWNENFKTKSRVCSFNFICGKC